MTISDPNNLLDGALGPSIYVFKIVNSLRKCKFGLTTNTPQRMRQHHLDFGDIEIVAIHKMDGATAIQLSGAESDIKIDLRRYRLLDDYVDRRRIRQTEVFKVDDAAQLRLVLALIADITDAVAITDTARRHDICDLKDENERLRKIIRELYEAQEIDPKTPPKKKRRRRRVVWGEPMSNTITKKTPSPNMRKKRSRLGGSGGAPKRPCM
jgi:hypothetical protein